MSLDLSKSQRRKLAKAARELAGEYAEGRGPKLEPFSWCGCAAGVVFKRAGIDNSGHGENAARADSEFGMALTSATHRQAYGVRDENGDRYKTRGAVVFPLLWFADWLEEQ